MTTPTDQPNVLLFGLCCIAMFCFYSFPVSFSWLSRSNRRLLTLHLTLVLARDSQSLSQPWWVRACAVWPLPISMVTWFTCCLCWQWGGQRQGAAYANWPSLSSANSKANLSAWVGKPECSTPVCSVPGPTILAPPLPLCRARELGCEIATVSLVQHPVIDRKRCVSVQ